MRGFTLADVAFLAPKGGPFNAADWANLLFWNDPSDAANRTESSGILSAVADKSGNGYTLNGLAGSVPINTHTINGVEAMHFDGTNEEMGSSTSYNLSGKAITLFIVFKPSSVAPSSQGVFYVRVNGTNDYVGVLIEPRGSVLAINFGRGSGTTASQYRRYDTASGALVAGTSYVLGITVTTGAPALWMNGSSVTINGTTGTMNIANFLADATTPCVNRVGLRNGTTLPAFGEIGDIVGYTGVKSSGDVVAISNALRIKYSI